VEPLNLSGTVEALCRQSVKLSGARSR